jgi:S1-C subfamily serine protease
MDENQSDGDGDWEQPQGYTSPWAPREPENGDQDTIAYGVPVGDAGDPGQGSSAPGDSRDEVWYGSEPGYGSYGDRADQDQAGYGRSGSGTGHGGSGYQTRYGGSGYETRYGGSGSGTGHGGSGYGTGGPGHAGWGLSQPAPPRRSRGRGRLLVYVTVAALAAGVGAGLTVAFDNSGASSSPGISASDVPVPHDNAAGNGSSANLNQAAVERRVKPGLVDIVATLKYASEAAEGTGMILSPSGLVLTNNHVIDGATSVDATVVGTRQRYRARVIGYDDTDDVALLQLTDASGLTAVSFGNSSQVSVGTAVLALGNAEGRGGATPSQGIINALNTSIQASDAGSDTTEDLHHMLQTNALIQQGDSGGALANNAGQVIGMITAANTSPGQSGQPGGTLGFAIPIDGALAIARQIAAGDASSTVYIGTPGFLGVVVSQSDDPNPQQQAAEDQQSANGGRASRNQGPGGGNGACVGGGEPSGIPARIAPASSGALILGILCNTAAANVRGLAPGDVITSIDGKAITTPDALTTITARYHPGNVVTVGWLGIGGARHTTSIKLGSGPAR